MVGSRGIDRRKKREIDIRKRGGRPKEQRGDRQKVGGGGGMAESGSSTSGGGVEEQVVLNRENLERPERGRAHLDPHRI